MVGTKLDLREDKEEMNKLESEGKSPLKYVDGLKLKRKIGAEKYLECSAKTMTNVHQIFEEAIRAALVHMNPKPTKRRRCTLLWTFIRVVCVLTLQKKVPTLSKDLHFVLYAILTIPHLCT